jgi:hypothetical protein
MMSVGAPIENKVVNGQRISAVRFHKKDNEKVWKLLSRLMHTFRTKPHRLWTGIWERTIDLR